MTIKKVRIGSLLVKRSKATFREAAQDIDVRKALFAEVVAKAEARGVQVLVLPAGFFRTASVREANELAKQLCALIAAREVVVGFGIDIGDAEKPVDKRNQEEGGLYPFLGFILERGTLLVGPVQQTGVSSHQVDEATAEDRADARIGRSSLVPGASIALLLCGEVLSPSWHAALHRRSPSIVLHAAHASVQLDGGAKESWRLKIAGLLEGLPKTTVWAFADHVAGEQHLDSLGDFVPLVRQGDSKAASLVSDEPVEAQGEHGWFYVYDAVIAPPTTS
jgi:hypothetical protein